MYKKDYLKRQIDTLVRELLDFLSGTNSNEDKLIIIDKLSIKYTNQKINYFINLDVKEIIEQYNNPDTLEIIAELLLSLSPKREILLKIQEILEYINKVSGEYSIIRQGKLLKIQEFITERYV